jgi:hypothetical protein
MQKLNISVIVPVMAPEAAKDWSYVQSCLNRTLRSILANCCVTRIYVICQSRPDGMIKNERIEFLKSENPIPKQGDRDARMNDKGSKLLQGMRVASNDHPNYVMFVDADDMISRSLFESVVNDPGYDAYCINRGYEWFEGAQTIRKIPHFHKYCGSSFILKFSKDIFPNWLGGQSQVSRVADQSHMSIEQSLRDHQFKIKYINSPMVIYVSGGTDQYRARGKRLRRRLVDFLLSPVRKRKINQQMRHEFSME